MLTDKPSDMPVKRSLSDSESLDEPPTKISKIEPVSNTVCGVEISDLEPMTKEHLQTIRVEILRKIVTMDKVRRPRMFKWEYKNGCLTVKCADEDSRNWLIEFVSELKPWPEAQLSAKDIDLYEIEDDKTSIVKYIYTKDRLYFIDITKTTEYSGIYSSTNESFKNSPANNFVKCFILKQEGKKPFRFRGSRSERKKKRKMREEAARLAAGEVKLENDDNSFIGVAIKEEQQDTEDGVTGIVYDQQIEVKTEQEIKAELLDAGEIDPTIPSYIPPININGGRQIVVVPPYGHYQCSQDLSNTENASGHSQIPNSGSSKTRRKKGNSPNVRGGTRNKAVTVQSKSLKEQYLEFLSRIE